MWMMLFLHSLPALISAIPATIAAIFARRAHKQIVLTHAILNGKPVTPAPK